MIKRLGRKITKGIFGGRIIRSIGREVRRWFAPDMPGKEALRVQREGSDFYIPVQYGQGDVMGVVVDKNVSADKKFLHMLIVFCAGEIDQFVRFEIDGYKETDEKFNKDGGGKWFSYETRLGSETQTPMSGAGKFNRWDATNSHYRGVACALFTFEMDNDQQLWRGEPQVKAFIRGRKVHDPRTNSVIYTENGALHALDYARNTRFGLALPEDEINVDSFITAANICDITEGGNTVTRRVCQWIGGNYVCTNEPATTEGFKRFTHNNLIDTQQQTTQNLQEIVNSFRGYYPDSDGRLSVAVEMEGSPVFDFHDGNIVSDISSSTGDIDERYNRVTVRFRNVENDYERDEVTFPDSDSQLYADWLAEDNGLLLDHVIDADHIIYKAEALQLAELAAYISRNSDNAEFTGDFDTIQVDVGDIVTLTNDDRGWDNRTFRVSKLNNREDGLTDFTLTQHDDGLYPWSPVAYTEIIGGSNLGDPRRPPAPTGLTITPDPTFATSGRLSWNPPTGQFIRNFEVRVVQGGNQILEAMTTAPNWAIPLLDVGSYSIEVRSTSSTGAFSPAAAIAFTLAIPAPPSDITLTPYNFEIEAAAVLAGIGLGTTFDYDIKETGDAGGYSPFARARGVSVTFAGLKTDTDYTVFARTVNALGVSSWISRTVTTTKDASSIIDLIGEDFADTIFEPVVEELTERVGRANQRVADVRVNIVEEIRSRLGIAKERVERKTGIERLEVVIDEESFKLAALSQEVTAVVGSTAAISGLLQAAGLDEDGNTFATVALDARLETAEDEITAQAGLILDVVEDVDENKSALAGLRTAVAGSDSQSQAELILESTVDKADEAFSRAFLGVTTTVGGVSRINGIVVDGSTNSLEFRADTIRWTDTGGNVQLYWDAPRSKVVFAGDMVAGTFQTATSGFRAEMSGSGSFPFWYGTGTKNLSNARFAVDGSGNVTMRNGNIQFVGSSHLRIESGEPFGPHDLISWFGPRINGVTYNNSTGLPILSGMVRTNAITYLDQAGNAYFGGSIIAGVLRNSATSSQTGNEMWVETNTFQSEGGPILIKCSIVGSATSSSNVVCPSVSNPSAQLRLIRLSPSGPTQVATQTITGTVNAQQEGSLCIIQRSINGSFTFTDNLLTSQNRNYRLEATVALDPDFPGGTKTQRLSIQTEE